MSFLAIPRLGDKVPLAAVRGVSASLCRLNGSTLKSQAPESFGDVAALGAADPTEPNTNDATGLQA